MQFDLHEQWKLYLQRVGLKQENLHPIQLTETKRAFYGACGQMLILFRDDLLSLADFEEEEIEEELKKMIQQVQHSWNSQI